MQGERLVESCNHGTLSGKMRERVRGLFITGTDTNVGKTHVGALVAQQLYAAGCRVGVYKPAASGCRHEGGNLVSDDARALWRAAGSPGELERVCPQRFLAPLAPHLAARAAGRRLDERLLLGGLDYWCARSDVVLVEGAGGLLSPLGEEALIADLASAIGFPLLVVARNSLGAINQTLQTLLVAAHFRAGLPVAGVVLNQTAPAGDDRSLETNRQEISRRTSVPVLAAIDYGSQQFSNRVDWLALAGPPGERRATLGEV